MFWRVVAMTAMLSVAGFFIASNDRANARPPDEPATVLPSVTVTSPRDEQKHNGKRKPDAAPQSSARVSRRAGQHAAAGPSSNKPIHGAGSSSAASNTAASASTVSGEEVNSRPFSRPGEALEVVPGLIVTQHSGEGKANQYFLRGFNLDHGTDFAITVDDMPVNMRTHAHGQGYSDLNFLMPELIGSVGIRKGPYFADEGDFASAGAAHISLVDSLKSSMASLTLGSFGYRRVFGAASQKTGDGTLLIAGEAGTYDGPWVNPDDVRKLNALVRYSQGTADDGFSLTAMAYSNRWNSSDQIPLRAITSGEVGLYGEFDPSDGGNSSRFSISGRWAQTDDQGSSKVSFYAIRSSLNLWNDFTFYLSNPDDGDQFHQHDDRVLGGLNASHVFKGSFGGLPTETEIGLQSRYDDIALALTNTVRRQYLSTTRSDLVREGSIGLYAQNTLHWTDWLRTYVGYRGDVYAAKVDSIYDAFTAGPDPANSGRANAAIGSPKAGIVFGPFAGTEFYLDAGEGFHSNDARGVTIAQSPTDGSPLASSPFLIRTRGAEVGVRTRAIPGLESTFSVFILDSASEIVFSGDAGDTEASRPSRRTGFEWTNRYHPARWFELDVDLAMTRARFRGYDSEQAALYASLAGTPEAQIGNAPGNLIPGAPNMIASAGFRLGEATGWFAGLRYRYFGPRPLTEDGAFMSPATGLLNGEVGYKFPNGWRVQLDGFNLANSHSDQVTYAYGSLLKSDALYTQCYVAHSAPASACAVGVMDSVLHPVEPLAVRLTIAGSF